MKIHIEVIFLLLKFLVSYHQVVYREAIFYGTSENREKVSLICWLLPYMQRYIYKMHRDTYIYFQKNDIMKISNLQVVVVDKLFHKYVLRGLESSSKKRFKCHCLLQVSIYVRFCHQQVITQSDYIMSFLKCLPFQIGL